MRQLTATAPKRNGALPGVRRARRLRGAAHARPTLCREKADTTTRFPPDFASGPDVVNYGARRILTRVRLPPEVCLTTYQSRGYVPCPTPILPCPRGSPGFHPRFGPPVGKSGIMPSPSPPARASRSNLPRRFNTKRNCSSGFGETKIAGARTRGVPNNRSARGDPPASRFSAEPASRFARRRYSDFSRSVVLFTWSRSTGSKLPAKSRISASFALASTASHRRSSRWLDAFAASTYARSKL